MRARPRFSALTLAVAIGLVALALPRPTVACSCMMVDRPMREAAAAPDLSVFSGVAGPLQAIGVPIQITRWFHGEAPPSGVAVLDPAGFEDPMGGMCGTHAPGFGTEWIFVAGRDDVGRYGVSLCTTHAPLDTEPGRALLAEAIKVFGPAVVVDPASPEPASPEPAPAAAADGPDSLISSVVPIVIAVLIAAGLLVGLLTLLGPRRPR